MRGSISIFLALVLVSCLSLVGAILESARVKGLRLQTELAADAAMDSVFAGYDGDLFDRFGLLLLNEQELDQSLTEKLEEYLSLEMDPIQDQLFAGGSLYRGTIDSVSVSDVFRITDEGGRFLEQEVVEYMKYKAVGNLVSGVKEQIDILNRGESAKELSDQNKLEEEGTDWGSLQSGVSAQKEGADDEETGAFDRERYEKEKDGSIIASVDAVRKDGWLKLILPAESLLSGAAINTSGLPSAERSKQNIQDGGTVSEIGRTILFDEYLLSHFTSFVSKDKHTGMQYQLEYILFGKSTDEANIKSCINRLLWVREGLNIIHIMSSGEKMAEAEAMALVMVGWTLIPPLVTLTKYIVAGAWAYAESIMDVRTLLGGGEVPLLKSAEDWRLSLNGIGSLISHEDVRGGEDSKGLDYEGYLRILLTLQNKADKYYRTMDMIQDSMQQIKPSFRMESCIYACTAGLQVGTTPFWGMLSLLQDAEKAAGRYQFSTNVGRMY